MAGRVGGYGRSAEGYRERLSKPQKFPNRRRRIITGRDLTTPLRGTTRIKSHKKVAFKTKTVAVAKEMMPWVLILKIVAFCAAACLLVLSYIFLFDTERKINETVGMINAAQIETSSLERQLDSETNSAEILRLAREDFGMVEERYIQRKFISSRNENRVIIPEGNNGILQGVLSAFWGILGLE